MLIATLNKNSQYFNYNQNKKNKKKGKKKSKIKKKIINILTHF